MASLVGFLAYGYAFVINLNPFIYVNFLVTIAYVFLAMLFISLVNNLGKNRNYIVSIIIATAISLFGLSVVWVSYISFVFDRSLLTALNEFWHGIDILSGQSLSIGRSFRRSTEFSGGVLYFFWIIEALVLLIGPILMVLMGGKDAEVFCEDCGKWTETRNTLLKSTNQNFTKEKIEDLVNQNRLNVLLELTDAISGIGNYLKIELAGCNNCEKCYYITVDYIRNIKNDKGENEETEKKLFPYYKLDPYNLPKELKEPADSNLE